MSHLVIQTGMGMQYGYSLREIELYNRVPLSEEQKENAEKQFIILNYNRLKCYYFYEIAFVLSV